MKSSAVVIEDQPIVWEYIKSCLDGLCDIKAFCTNTKESEQAIKEFKPDFIWLDCYLGEIADNSHSIKNSGLQMLPWIKKHYPATKIFLFSASNETIILRQAQQYGVEGIALSGKYIADKSVVIEGVKTVLEGRLWLSPQVLESYELKHFNQVTLFEFSVVTSLILGKNTSQIAEELNTTRKMINNSVYRIKRKLSLDPELSREDFLELVREKIISSFDTSKYYNLTEIIAINTMVQNCLDPVIEKIRSNELKLKKLVSK